VLAGSEPRDRPVDAPPRNTAAPPRNTAATPRNTDATPRNTAANAVNSPPPLAGLVASRFAPHDGSKSLHGTEARPLSEVTTHAG
jgi:hypothetical protein